MNKETEHLEKLKALAKEAESDFFNNLDEEWLKSDIGLGYISISDFEGYLGLEEKYKMLVKKECPNNYPEKWNIFKEVAVQVLEQSGVMWGNNVAIINLLPFVSSLVYTENALWIKIDKLTSKMLCAFANVCKGDYTYEGDGVYCARWEGTVWQEETIGKIGEMLGKKGYKVL